jgi:hypothetical protein
MADDTAARELQQLRYRWRGRVPLDVARGRYRPDDQLLVFLEAL